MSEASSGGLRRVRGVFSRERSFRGAEIGIARRFSKVGWAIGGIVGLALVPFYPPTALIGSAGWAFTAVDAVLTGAWLFYLFRFNDRVTFETLLGTAYFGLFNVAIAQCLAGGLPAAYHELYPFMIVAAASVHPPRRFFPFLAVLLAAAIGPELGHAQAAEVGDLLTELTLWIPGSLMVLALMWRLRQERADREERHDEAQELARVDALTRLGNRRAFEETVASEIARSRRNDEPLCLLVCDLDNFKAINDDYGHLAGDDCLRQVASALGDELRVADRCFRWGGDEFIVLLPDTDELAAIDIGARLEQRVATSCARPDEAPLEITTGHATLLDWMSMDDLVAAADRALLARKGRPTAPPAS